MLAPHNRLSTLIATANVAAMGSTSYLARPEVIDPVRAQDLLDHMIKNRPVNRNAVNDYSRKLETGKWRLNGQPIVISDDGELLDGQHRLLACVATGMSFVTFVIYGIDKATFATFDTGRTRGGKDIIGIAQRGEVVIDGVSPAHVASLVAGTVRVSMIVENALTAMSFTLDNEAIELKYAKDGERLLEAVKATRGITHLRPSLAAGLYYNFARADKAWADIWVSQMETGAGLNVGDPVLVYRERLTLANSGKKKVTKLATIERLAMGVRTWNALVTGVPIKQLKGTIIVGTKKTFPPVLKPTTPAPVKRA